MDKASVYDIICSDVIEITQKVAGITLVQSSPVDISDAYTLHLSARGENTYRLDLYLYADVRTLGKIADHMKRGKATPEDIPLYTSEFFNILGGHIVSKINRCCRQSARFKPPVFLDYRAQPDGSGGSKMMLNYRFQDGAVKVLGYLVQS